MTHFNEKPKAKRPTVKRRPTKQQKIDVLEGRIKLLHEIINDLQFKATLQSARDERCIRELCAEVLSLKAQLCERNVKLINLSRDNVN